MTVYVQRRCWSCNAIMEHYTRDYRSIGIPFTRCNCCNSFNRYTHINEWDLKNNFDKICYLGVTAYTVFIWALLPAFIPILVLSQFLDWGLTDQNFYWSYGVGLVIVAPIYILDLISEIKMSRVRLQDLKYLETLKKLRIIE